jgi:hypothetical protein
MPTNGSAPLLLKRAKLDKQSGVLTVARDAVSWQPDDPGSSQQPASVAVSAITSELVVALPHILHSPRG